MDTTKVYHFHFPNYGVTFAAFINNEDVLSISYAKCNMKEDQFKKSVGRELSEFRLFSDEVALYINRDILRTFLGDQLSLEVIDRLKWSDVSNHLIYNLLVILLYADNSPIIDKKDSSVKRGVRGISINNKKFRCMYWS